MKKLLQTGCLQQFFMYVPGGFVRQWIALLSLLRRQDFPKGSDLMRAIGTGT
jgi:hypothetical protein